MAMAALERTLEQVRPGMTELAVAGVLERALRDAGSEDFPFPCIVASGERAALYARLKLAGLSEAPCQFAVFADRTTEQGHGLGRLTMPATIEYSAVMAVHTLWLAARAEGIGMGWVSILDPIQMATILEAPPEWTFIGYFCVGYPTEEQCTPVLEQEGWEFRRPSTIITR